MGVDMGSVQTKMEISNGGQPTARSKPQACKVCIYWIRKGSISRFIFFRCQKKPKY